MISPLLQIERQQASQGTMMVKPAQATLKQRQRCMRLFHSNDLKDGGAAVSLVSSNPQRTRTLFEVAGSPRARRHSCGFFP